MFKILIVDSDAKQLQKFHQLPIWTEATGFEITAKAYDGKQGLKLLQQQHFDMVISDINLPFIDGLQLLRQVNQEKLCPIFVVLCDNTEFHYVRECLIFGAFDYLQKLPENAVLKSLLERAALYLKSQETNQALLSAYPLSKQQELLTLFQQKNPFAIQYFENSLQEIYHHNDNAVLKADMSARKFYRNLISGIFDNYSWLKYYQSKEDYFRLDYLQDDSPRRFTDFFMRKLTSLFQFIQRFEPQTSDTTLAEICSYILQHPEADLRLKSIAHKFFLNHTYLCGHFSAKLNLYYSDYVGMIKMARAEYLLNHSNYRIYEICEQLGYQDTNYFSKQFKKFHGQSPTTYREISYQDYSFL